MPLPALVSAKSRGYAAGKITYSLKRFHGHAPLNISYFERHAMIFCYYGLPLLSDGLYFEERAGPLMPPRSLIVASRLLRYFLSFPPVFKVSEQWCANTLFRRSFAPVSKCTRWRVPVSRDTQVKTLSYGGKEATVRRKVESTAILKED